MIGVIAKFFGILLSRSTSIEDFAKESSANIDSAPARCRELIDQHQFIGCYHLPYLGGNLEQRSWISKFVFGYSKKYRCWFSYGANGVMLYISEDRYQIVPHTHLGKIRSNIKDGSLILLKIHQPQHHSLSLKFGEDSSALKFVEYLNSIIKQH